MFGEVEGVSFNDIDTFCQNIPAKENDIDIRLHCDGGSVLEGWAIYDRLRATGKNLTATVEGHAASMATIIMLAAAKGNRRAYKDAQICIHNPWVFTAAIGDTATADELQKAAKELKRDQRRLLNLYVERTGSSAETLQALMDEDTFIDVEKAKELGFIDEIIPHASAKANDKTNKGNNMKVLGKFFGKEAKAKVEVKGMELDTADGGVLTVEREEGEPQVGDAANPDGEHEMPNGTTIVVKDGVITEIKTDESDHDGDEGEEQKGAKNEATEEDTEVAELEAANEELKAENEELKEQVEELQEELEEAKAKAKTRAEMRILNAVKMAGGEKALARIASNKKPMPRKVTKTAAKDTVTSDELRERMKKLNK